MFAKLKNEMCWQNEYTDNSNSNTNVDEIAPFFYADCNS